MARISINYILLCGQVLLLLSVLLLQCLDGIHSQNSSDSPRQRATTKAAFREQSPQDNVTTYILPVDHTNSSIDQYEYSPPSPVVLCRYLPDEFVHCQDPVDHAQNHTAIQEMGHGCWKFGGQVHKDVNHTQVICTALDDIECAGPREFQRGNVPCIKVLCHVELPVTRMRECESDDTKYTPATISSPLCSTHSSWGALEWTGSASGTPARPWASC
uniref:Secreted protein n=1 Tax=Esox lucius TaxID=8010 RepID=A0AAY5KBU6_ESOLU